mgnify:CR=1 FL=1
MVNNLLQNQLIEECIFNRINRKIKGNKFIVIVIDQSYHH